MELLLSKTAVKALSINNSSHNHDKDLIINNIASLKALEYQLRNKTKTEAFTENSSTLCFDSGLAKQSIDELISFQRNIGNRHKKPKEYTILFGLENYLPY
jgi:hypothetical protein